MRPALPVSGLAVAGPYEAGNTVPGYCPASGLRDLPAGAETSIATKNADYYYRPLKTMLVRAVAGGGESHYIKGDHAVTFPRLWTAVTHGEADG